MINKLENIIDNSEEYLYRNEINGFNSIIPYILKNNGYEAIIYGNDNSLYNIMHWLKAEKVNPIYVIKNYDNNDSLFYDINIISLNNLKEKIKNKKIIALIDYAEYENNEIALNKLLKELLTAGCKRIYSPEINLFDYSKWKYWIKKYKKEYINFLSKLKDKLSKDLYIEYIRSIVEDDFFKINGENTNKKYFGENLFKWSEDECFLNCGAAVGDNIFFLVSNNYPFKKIYGIESDNKVFKELSQNINFLPVDIQAKINIYNETISSNGMKIDCLLENDPITLLALDVEGSELDLLMSMENIIINQEPILAISIYHKYDDFIEIPKYITQLSHNYNFYLRKYNPSRPKYSKDELVLYCIPNSRLLTENNDSFLLDIIKRNTDRC